MTETTVQSQSSAPAHGAHPPDPAAQLMQVATGYMASACLHVIARLKIADALITAPKPVAQLAATAHVDEDALYRVLRALASIGIFRETSPRNFANTAVSEAMLTRAHSLRDMVLFITDPFHFRTFAELTHTMETGESAVRKMTDLEPFEYLQKDKAEGEMFNAAMTSFSAMNMAAVLEAYDFSGLGTLADIAGGHGMVLSSILRKYPDLKGILFDQPHVVSGATASIEMEKLDRRFRIVAGDFFQAVPPADNYLLKHIIHDWDDDRAVRILQNCAEAMTGKGKVILLETVITPGNEPHLGKWIDIEMLVIPSGRERTEAEYAALFTRAGLRLSRVLPTKSPLSVIEAVKP